MLQNDYFKIIIDNLSTAVLLAESVYDKKNVLLDFKIIYMKESVLKMTKDLLKEGECFCDF